MRVDDIDRTWWKEAVVYQVYPRSFNDTDGDGVGDLPGVVERLDYLDALGVDVVWLNPVYESPGVDNGYDISDYRAIDPQFGTMADWEALLEGLHERGMRLIMDLVVNHTSDAHEWFQRSRDPDSPYRDWYWWREGRDAAAVSWDSADGPEGEAPPNNWESFFGGPAWSYDERSGEWYLHIFDERQPDLNWETPAVREAIYGMMEWWLEKGIDGFRMDVINLISKPPDLPPGDPDEPLSGQLEHTANGPRVHEYLGEMRDRVLAPADRELLTVGETVGAPMPIEHARRYVTEDGLSMIFHFEHVLLDRGDHVWERRDWSLPDLKAVFDRWQDGLEGGGWNSLYLNNHDQPRQVSRFGDDGEYRRESATLLATLLYTLRGTPFVYQGEELGMTNYPFESLAEFRDVDTVHALETAIETGEVSGFDAVADAVRANTRDNARTPMQWSDAAHAGFTSGEPWMPVNPNYERVNADRERAESGSVWHYYRRLVELRGANDVLVYGDYDPLTPAHEDLWVYTRALTDGTERDRLLVALNAAGTPTDYSVPPSLADPDAGCLLANYRHCEGAAVRPPTGTLTLRPWEARVYHSRVPAE